MARRFLLLSAAAGAGIIGMAAPSYASPVTDSFTGFITGVASDQFAGPYNFNAGDLISGSIYYDDSDVGTTFTATLTDVTTGSSFTLPSTATSPVNGVSVLLPAPTDTVTGAPPNYTVTADENLDFAESYTPFSADFALSLVNEIGTGSLSIDVPSEGGGEFPTGNPDETLSVTFDVPEPASMTLLGLAFAGLTRLRRRSSR
jgi:hypothetical protein